VNPDSATHKRIFALLTSAASSFAVDVVAAPVHQGAEIEEAMTEWGQGMDYCVIVPSDPAINAQRGTVIALAASHRLPVIYALRPAVVDGGLMSYGVDIPELFRRAASYADRILKGEKPADLPVQLPTKFELVINLKTAKALGFDVPMSLLATADEGDEIRALRRLQREQGPSSHVPTTERDGPMTPKAFHALFGRIGEWAKMPFPIHPHMLRHGCGYALANAGHDTRALQAWLGHKNIQHTVRYTELAPDRFKNFWR
jgi:ABC transporter substrate binding protein/Phage integrase family